MARLCEREREDRGFAEQVALVTGERVPEIVHVAELLLYELDVRIRALGAALHARFDEAVGRDAFAIEEREIRAAEAAVRHRGECGAIAERVEQALPRTQAIAARRCLAIAARQPARGAERECIRDPERLFGVARICERGTRRIDELVELAHETQAYVNRYLMKIL